MAKQVVKYLSHHGSDKYIAETARVSTQSKNLEVERFINFLIRNGHHSPFEFAQITFEIECPIFIARQFMRHRIASYVEKSIRHYKGDGNDIEFFEFNENDIENFDTRIVGHTAYHDDVNEVKLFDVCKEHYEDTLKIGIPSEQARAILPLATMTTFHVQFNLRSLMNFLKLRLDRKAQYEIQELAEMMYDIFEQHFPLTAKAFLNYILNAVSFSENEMKILLWYFNEKKDDKHINTIRRLLKSENVANDLTKNESEEFLNKLEINTENDAKT